jgi:ATP-dependent RNA helicase RhlE
MVDLRQIQILVLDEADRMLDMGFIHDIRRIVGLLPPKRQNLLFSATMPPEIRRLADTILHGPAVVQVATTSAVADRIDQSIYFVHCEGKPALLAHLFNELPIARAIVFTRTKHGADRLVRRLHTAGIRSEAIHGNKSQNARQKALANFRTGKTPLLIATDVASRGIDVDGITHVVNYDLTAEPETYVHRIGRTARAGASGSAISFCNEEERGNLKAIERLIRRSIPVKQATAVAALPRPQESVVQHQHTAPKAEMQSAASGGRAPRESGRFQHRQKTWKGQHPKRGASGHHAKARSFR